MFNRYFQEELNHLRELAREFSEAYPALAPFLSGPSADPDVERLLEGLAFLTALLRQKLDSEFPEILYELVELFWPHYLRPLPSASVVAFRPKEALKDRISVPRGTLVGSVPVEGTNCLFSTCYQVDVEPLTLEEVSQRELPGKGEEISLRFRLHDLRIDSWETTRLVFFLGGDFALAADLYRLLLEKLEEIELVSGERVFRISPGKLIPLGFSHEEALLPYPRQSFPGYRILQEYFLLPQKFLFVALTGLDEWRDRGEGEEFLIRFRFKESQGLPVSEDNFVLFATPVINLFPHSGEPIRLDHQRERYLVRASGGPGYEVYSIKKVSGLIQGTVQEREYVPFELFSEEKKPVYRVFREPSVTGPGFDLYLAVAYPPGVEIGAQEVLSLELVCTNGVLAERLQLGDISQPTSSTPEMVTFRNITLPTPYVLPPLGKGLLWRLIAHLNLNYVSLSGPEQLKTLLKLYIFTDTRDKKRVLANQKRVDGIEKVLCRLEDRLVSGVVMRGQKIGLVLRQDHFASLGDLYLFGQVLDHFFGVYGALNTFTHLEIEESLSGEVFSWPPRVGDRPLI